MAKVLSSSYINQHQYFTARKDAYQLPSGKIVDPYFVVELPTSVCAMAITTDGKVILVKQFRYPVNRQLIELPGGFIDEGEGAQQAIARELLEETGYSFDRIEALGATAANPGVLNNMTHLFIAFGGKPTSEQHLDPNEEISIHLEDLTTVKNMLDNNEILQSMHALCLFYGFEFLQKNGIVI